MKTNNVHREWLKNIQFITVIIYHFINYNENIFHRQQNFKLASGTHADLILIRDKKKQRNMSKIANKKEITKDRKNLLPY